MASWVEPTMGFWGDEQERSYVDQAVRWFGFVEMSSPEEALKAIEMFNGHSLLNRQIIVNEARPQTPRAPHSGRSTPHSA